MNSIWLRVLVGSAFLGGASCATLFQGTHEEIDLASDPSGVNTSISDGRSGVTPYSVHVDRDEDLQIHFSKPGYQNYDVDDVSHVEWGYFVADVFFTGLIGLAVDGIDGAMFYHSEQMVSAHLEALPGQPLVQAPVQPQQPIASTAAVTTAPPTIPVQVSPAAAAQARDDPNKTF
jgi:hypothetical protein